MRTAASPEPRDNDQCRVVGGTHAGKSGTVRDVKTSKTGHVTITVVQANGERFKTLARNVVVQSASGAADQSGTRALSSNQFGGGPDGHGA
jgi:ribosomal protein L24